MKHKLAGTAFGAADGRLTALDRLAWLAVILSALSITAAFVYDTTSGGSLSPIGPLLLALMFVFVGSPFILGLSFSFLLRGSKRRLLALVLFETASYAAYWGVLYGALSVSGVYSYAIPVLPTVFLGVASTYDSKGRKALTALLCFMTTVPSLAILHVWFIGAADRYLAACRALPGLSCPTLANVPFEWGRYTLLAGLMVIAVWKRLRIQRCEPTLPRPV